MSERNPPNDAPREAEEEAVAEHDESTVAESTTDSVADTAAADLSPAPESPQVSAADTSSEPPDSAPPAVANGRRRGSFLGTLVGVVAFACSLLALAASYYLWSETQRYDESIAALDARSAADAAEQDQTREAVTSLEGRVAALDDAGDLRAGRILELEDRVEDVPSQIGAIARRLESVQGGSVDSRAQWLLAEAEYYLGVANTELSLGNRWENAIAALELADDRLRALADPSFSAVRELIAGELLSLRSVRLPDTAGLAFSLSRLADRVGDLPMRRSGTPSSLPTPDPDESGEESGLTRLWNTTKEAFSSLIRIERSDAPLDVSLSSAERLLVQRQLAAELQLARVAIVARNTEDFAAGIAAATAILNRDFDTGAAEVEGALALLDELAGVDIAPTPPDISGSLITLRSLAAGDD